MNLASRKPSPPPDTAGPRKHGRARPPVSSFAVEQRVAIIEAELDLGAGRRGVDMGPSAIRYAGLGERLDELGIASEDQGNVYTRVRETMDPKDENARFLTEIRETRSGSPSRCVRRRRAARFLWCWAGTTRSRSGRSASCTSLHSPGGVLWFDAHADWTRGDHAERAVHGIPLAAVLGRAKSSSKATAGRCPRSTPNGWQIGARSVDPGERDALREAGVAVFTISDVDRRGVEAGLEGGARARLRRELVHVSVDLDLVDPVVAPGVGSPVTGGFSYREALPGAGAGRGERIAHVTGARRGEPILDHENATAKLAVELAASALGARIL